MKKSSKYSYVERIEREKAYVERREREELSREYFAEKKRLVNFRVSECLLEIIDNHAESLNITRSTMLELVLVFFNRYAVVSKNNVKAVEL
jgi:predicted DNA binding CopG/RHH family protein